MSNSSNSGDANLLANARARLQSVPQSKNPFQAGLDGGMANWREQRAADFASIRIPKADACPTCNKTIATSLPSCPHCGQELSQDIWKGALSARNAKSLRQIAYVLAALAVFGLYLYTRPGPTPEEQARQQGARDITTAAVNCDNVAEKSMRNPSSFSPAWTKAHRDTGTEIWIWRNYTATNVFGATMDSHYICTFNKLSQKIEDIQFREGKR